MKPEKIYSRDVGYKYRVECLFWIENDLRHYRITVDNLHSFKRMGFLRVWSHDVPMRTFAHVIETLLERGDTFDQIQEALNR